MDNYRIPDMVRQYTDYEMIRQHTELPEFPDVRTKLLYAFLLRSSRHTHTSELGAVVTSLVQMGLDTHDLVANWSGEENIETTRSRQLKVLAGDYFSSNFYYLLSRAGEIGMVKQLATAICELNRMKVNLYTLIKKAKLTADEYIRQVVDIRMHLFLSFRDYFQEQYQLLWPKLLHGFTYCEVIVDEIVRSKTWPQFRGGWAFWHILQHGTREEARVLGTEHPEPADLETLMQKYDLSAQLCAMLERRWEQLSALIERIDSPLLREELIGLGEPLTRMLCAHQVFEEI